MDQSAFISFLKQLHAFWPIWSHPLVDPHTSIHYSTATLATNDIINQTQQTNDDTDSPFSFNEDNDAFLAEKMHLNREFIFTITIFWNQSYLCPSLYFLVHDQSGVYLTLHEIHSSLHLSTEPSQTNLFDIVSETLNPLTNLTSFCLHPCGTPTPSSSSFAHTIIIRILSNWGHPSEVGLNAIQLFLKKGTKFSLSKARFSLRAGKTTFPPAPNSSLASFINVQSAGKKSISKQNVQEALPIASTTLHILTSSKPGSTNESSTWKCPFIATPASQPLEIVIEIPPITPLLTTSTKSQNENALVIWNVNTNSEEAKKGAKKVEIEHNGELIFKGDLPRGLGNVLSNCSKAIPIRIDTSTKRTPSPQPPIQQKSKSKSPHRLSVGDHLQHLIDQRNSLQETLLGTFHEVSVRVDSPPTLNSIEFCLQSNWGHPSLIGLSHIDMFDKNGRQILFTDPARNISLKRVRDSGTSPMVESVKTTGHVEFLLAPNTAITEEVWRGTYSKSTTMIVHVDFNTSTTLSFIRIRNYSTNRVRSSICVKNIDIFGIAREGKTENRFLIATGMIDRLATKGKTDFFEVNFVSGKAEEDMLQETLANIVDNRRKEWAEKNWELIDNTQPAAAQKHVSWDATQPKQSGTINKLDTFVLNTDGTFLPTIRPLTQGGAPEKNIAAVSSFTQEEPSERTENPVPHIPSFAATTVLPSDSADEMVFRTPISGTSTRPIPPTNYPTVTTVTIQIGSTWGDVGIVGLRSVELVDSDGIAVPDDSVRITSTLSTALQQSFRQTSTKQPNDPTHALTQPLANLLVPPIDGDPHSTTDPSQSWACIFTQPIHSFGNQASVASAPPELTFTLSRPIQLKGLRLSNFNTSFESSYWGIKDFVLFLDGELFGEFVARKGTGIGELPLAQFFDFDIGAYIALDSSDSSIENPPSSAVVCDLVKQPYIPPLLPTGFVWSFRIYSTWGDPHYVGLNGIQLLDDKRRIINLITTHSVALLNDEQKDEEGRLCYSHLADHPHSFLAALPPDISDLPDSQHDVRTFHNLTCPPFHTRAFSSSWLAPFTPSESNTIHLIFNQPQTVSQIKLFNYSKTPERGVKEFDLSVDGFLLFRGLLNPAATDDEKAAQPKRPKTQPLKRAQTGSKAREDYQSILFTSDKAVIGKECCTVLSQPLQNNVVLINNGQVMSEYQPKPASRPQSRPKTALNARF
ncbi:putative Katanin-interacting protein [Blattamonas nauphoetae]|uniref:Katanin-interacting protein n=1 Tax=Blattamonas nauphoetae TaxID=2049346 RepID=A0ABQ9YKF5_9EUKA|nr:putative Katanin-interacting protein [Blattamonas nauphoetae]